MYILSYYFVSQSSAAIRETSRLASTTNSPIISFFDEATSGSSTIRAFEK